MRKNSLRKVKGICPEGEKKKKIHPVRREREMGKEKLHKGEKIGIHKGKREQPGIAATNRLLINQKKRKGSRD